MASVGGLTVHQVAQAAIDGYTHCNITGKDSEPEKKNSIEWISWNAGRERHEYEQRTKRFEYTTIK